MPRREARAFPRREFALSASTVLAHTLAAFAAAEFCGTHQTGRTALWSLEKAGRAPATRRAEKRTPIGAGAARRRQREQEATHKAATTPGTEA
jgi:hypothetical protein